MALGILGTHDQPPKLMITGATSSNVSSIKELLHSSGNPVAEQTIRGWVNSGLSVVAKLHSGKVAAHQAGEICEDGTGRLVGSAVSSAYKGSGIGSQLHNAMHQLLREKGCPEIIPGTE